MKAKKVHQYAQNITGITRNTYYKMLAVLFAGLVGGAGSALASFPGNNGKLVFGSSQYSEAGSTFAIYVSNPDGSGPQKLTNSGYYPKWSPDGTKIVFSSYKMLNLMNADGSNLTKIALTDSGGSSIYSPSWSPDGTKLLYSDYEKSRTNDELYAVNTDGFGKRRITNNAGTSRQDKNPAWSPNGTKIAFARYPGGCCVNDSFIYTLNAVDGSGLKKLTKNPKGDKISDSGTSTTGHSYDKGPSWSPDGTKIAFTRDNGTTRADDVYVMNADGTNLKRLTTNPKYTTLGGPAWSPDGTKIIYSNGYSVFSMNPDGTGRNPLPYSPPSTGAQDPDWQPLQ